MASSGITGLSAGNKSPVLGGDYLEDGISPG